MTRLMSLVQALSLAAFVLLPLSGTIALSAEIAAPPETEESTTSTPSKTESTTTKTTKTAESADPGSSDRRQQAVSPPDFGQSSETRAAEGKSATETKSTATDNKSGETKSSDSKSGEAKSPDGKAGIDSKTSDKKQSASVRSKGGKHGKKILRGNAPCLAWLEAGVPIKAVVLCVHGLGLHNGTYGAFGKRLAKLGFATYAIDVRGFGSWMEAKGRERVDFEGCLDDLTSTLKVIRRAHKGLPVFVLGESMGGAIALRITAMRPDLVDGLISSVPAGDRFKQGKTALNVAFHYLDGANKQFNVGEKIIEQATQKPELREAWSKDPLARLKLSPNELMQFQHFMDQNHKQARLITDKPVLFVQGVKDKLVRPEGTVELYNQLATKDREIVLIPNAEHLIFEEEQFTDKDIEVVSNWLNAHLPKTTSDVNITKAEK